LHLAFQLTGLHADAAVQQRLALPLSIALVPSRVRLGATLPLSFGGVGLVHADEKLTAFLELESAIRACGELC
jgi:hypothetical protein